MEGGDNNKKYWIVGGLAILGLGALLVKNIIQEKNFVPIKREQLLEIMIKLKQINQKNLVELANCMGRIGPDLRNLSSDILKQLIQSPESPYPIKNKIEENTKNVCSEFGISISDFQANLKYYEKDIEVIKIQTQFQQNFQKSLKGQSPIVFKPVAPQPKASAPAPAPVINSINVPNSVTADVVLRIYHKMVQKTLLLKLQKIREVIEGRISAEDINKPQYQKMFANPTEQHRKIIQQEKIDGFSQLEEFNAAVKKFGKANPNFAKQLQSIDVEFAKMIKKYGSKVDKYQLTIQELDQLEQDLIFHQKI